MKKTFIIILLILFFWVVFWFYLGQKEDKNENVPYDSFNVPQEEKEPIAENVKRDSIKGTEKIVPIEESQKIISEIPEEIKIEVPFTSQAPYGVWDERHEEACEEASLLMVAKYLKKESLNTELAEEEIQKIINFQIEKYGDYKDSDAERTKEIAEDFYGIKNLEVIYDFKKEELKKELAKGNPIIVPAAGRLLGNPYFTPPGPLYHNLVLIGYEGDKIITNDSGTRRGKDYIYDMDVLYEAIHDFTGNKDEIDSGRKAMIVISF